MMRMVRLICSGLGTLPGVGSHPGLPLFGALVLVAAFHGGGVSGGAVGALIGAAIMVFGLGPFLLYGAYRRALTSKRYLSGGE